MDAQPQQNDESTPVDVIVEQMLEPRPLPIGMKEIETWSDRIISGALIPAFGDDPETQYDSQKFALARMLIDLNPTEDHECDGYFIKRLRKAAVSQVAAEQMKTLKAKADARLKQKGEEIAAKLAESSGAKAENS